MLLWGERQIEIPTPKDESKSLEKVPINNLISLATANKEWERENDEYNTTEFFLHK